MLSLAVSHPVPSSLFQTLCTERALSQSVCASSLIVSSQHLWLEPIRNLNLESDKVVR